VVISTRSRFLAPALTPALAFALVLLRVHALVLVTGCLRSQPPSTRRADNPAGHRRRRGHTGPSSPSARGAACNTAHRARPTSASSPTRSHHGPTMTSTKWLARDWGRGWGRGRNQGMGRGGSRGRGRHRGPRRSWGSGRGLCGAIRPPNSPDPEAGLLRPTLLALLGLALFGPAVVHPSHRRRHNLQHTSVGKDDALPLLLVYVRIVCPRPSASVIHRCHNSTTTPTWVGWAYG
jgi:hypothetical protein